MDTLAPDRTAAENANRPALIDGQRIFTAGHSFHVFIAPTLAGLARSAGITGHVNLGMQFLGGSRVIEHWNRAEPYNDAKRTLRTGRVDVLTLSPTIHPDPGIDRFVRLAREHNPDVRVTVQVSWVPFDGQLYAALNPGKANRDALPAAALRQMHAPYFDSVAAELQALNRAYGRAVLTAVPVGQALLALRERIRAGQAPGLTSQEELFTDALGHPALPVQWLATYCHFAVIYQRTPVGLPAPARHRIGEPLNRLLQELAWQAVIQHPFI